MGPEVAANPAPLGRLGIWREGGIGDGLLLAPALAALRREHPEIEVHLWARREACVVLRRLGLISTHGDLARGLRLPECGLDGVLALDWGPPEAITRAVGGLGVQRARAFQPLERHHVQRHRFAKECLDTLLAQPLRTFNAAEKIDYAPTADRGLRRALGRRVLLAPSASSGPRRHLWDHLQAAGAALRHLGVPVAVIEGPSDDFTSDLPVVDLSFEDLLDGLPFCRGVIANDSSVAHLASLLGVPTVIVYGPNSSRTWGPAGPRTHVIHRCSHVEPDAAPTHHNCYADIHPDELVEALFALEEA